MNRSAILYQKCYLGYVYHLWCLFQSRNKCHHSTPYWTAVQNKPPKTAVAFRNPLFIPHLLHRYHQDMTQIDKEDAV